MAQSLEHYIRRIQRCGRIFDYGIFHAPPRLRPGIINHILFYPGSFNPPHMGHLSLLQHVFEHSGSGMNIIAAIVFPLDDEVLAENLETSSSNMLLTKAERVRLWRGHGLATFFWVYDYSASCWKAFESQLIHDVSRDGFELEFLVLCGPDHLQDMHTFPSMPWGMRQCLVSDIGRDLEITSPTKTTIRQLDLYGPWRRTIIDCDSLRKEAESRLISGIARQSMVGPKSTEDMLRRDPAMIHRMVQEKFEELLASASRVWVCHRSDNPTLTIRFIPKPEKGKVLKVSSSMIRKLIQDSPLGQREIKLNELVLNPDILLEILALRPQGQHE